MLTSTRSHELFAWLDNFKATPKHPLVPGFPVALNLWMFIGTEEKYRYCITLRLELGLVNGQMTYERANSAQKCLIHRQML